VEGGGVALRKPPCLQILHPCRHQSQGSGNDDTNKSSSSRLCFNPLRFSLVAFSIAAILLQDQELI
jgi:hypothetical protein